MKKVSKFPKIGQYRNVVKEIQVKSSYVGQDRGDNPMYDNTLPKPIITFKGTVKLHGCNSSVAHTFEDGLWVQSKNQIITPEDDNYGFAAFVEERKKVFQDLINRVRDMNKNIIGDNDGVVIYMEFVGKGIQKVVAISQIEKSAFIFDVKIIPENGDKNYYIKSEYLRDNDSRIYNIEDFLSYKINIDFNEPERFQNELKDITQKIENLCPVGKSFGVDGVGEGLVWCGTWKGEKYRFKVKGTLHSKSKVKTLKPVDDEKINKLIQLAEKVTPSWRLEQMFNLVTKNGEDIDRKYIGDYIRSVIKDIREEDLDLIEDAGFILKDITKYVSKISKEYFFQMEKI